MEENFLFEKDHYARRNLRNFEKTGKIIFLRALFLHRAEATLILKKSECRTNDFLCRYENLGGK